MPIMANMKDLMHAELPREYGCESSMDVREHGCEKAWM